MLASLNRRAAQSHVANGLLTSSPSRSIKPYPRPTQIRLLQMPIRIRRYLSVRRPAADEKDGHSMAISSSHLIPLRAAAEFYPILPSTRKPKTKPKHTKRARAEGNAGVASPSARPSSLDIQTRKKPGKTPSSVSTEKINDVDRGPLVRQRGSPSPKSRRRNFARIAKMASTIGLQRSNTAGLSVKDTASPVGGLVDRSGAHFRPNSLTTSARIRQKLRATSPHRTAFDKAAKMPPEEFARCLQRVLITIHSPAPLNAVSSPAAIARLGRLINHCVVIYTYPFGNARYRLGSILHDDTLLLLPGEGQRITARLEVVNSSLAAAIRPLEEVIRLYLYRTCSPIRFRAMQQEMRHFHLGRFKPHKSYIIRQLEREFRPLPYMRSRHPRLCDLSYWRRHFFMMESIWRSLQSFKTSRMRQRDPRVYVHYLTYKS